MTESVPNYSVDAQAAQLADTLFGVADHMAAEGDSGTGAGVRTMLVRIHDIWLDAVDRYLDPRGALYEEAQRYSIPRHFPFQLSPDMPTSDLCCLVYLCRDDNSPFDVPLRESEVGD